MTMNTVFLNSKRNITLSGGYEMPVTLTLIEKNDGKINDIKTICLKGCSLETNSKKIGISYPAKEICFLDGSQSVYNNELGHEFIDFLSITVGSRFVFESLTSVLAKKKYTKLPPDSLFKFELDDGTNLSITADSVEKLN